jgi:RND family efflux transporter MFP subunit
VTHKRFSDLLAKKSVSQSEFDEAEARLKSAQAAVEMAQSRRRQAEAKRSQVEAQIADVRAVSGYAKIHAPFAGIVTERLMDPGTLATPGMPILTIERGGGYRLEASVPESKQSLARRGQTIAVHLEAIGEALEGRVDEIVPQVDAASRTILVKIALPNVAGLRSGMYGRAEFPGGAAREALTVPAEAVIERGQIRSVFVVDGDTARRRLVTLGAEAGERREVLSGLVSGEQVVLSPGVLTDGHPVSISGVVEPPTAAAHAGSGR